MLRLLLSLFIGMAAPAQAHFTQGTQLREIVLDRSSRETYIYVRAPIPLIYADVIDSAAAQNSPLQSDDLYLEQTGAGPRYRLRTGWIAKNPELFTQRLSNHLSFTRNGVPVTAEVERFRLLPRRPAQNFDSAAAARASLSNPSTSLEPVFATAIVEYNLRLADGEAPIAVQSSLPRIALPEGVTIDNHLTLDMGTNRATQRTTGQLQAPRALETSAISSLTSFMRMGFQHIITGYDHVFLVICFTLGIASLGRLFWVITGFTLGHSVTLGMGAAGLVPQQSWFIPTIEAAIAISVVLAAWLAWRSRPQTWRASASVMLAIGIGLIHGFGFASFLSQSLTPGAPGFIPAVAGFNIGIEFGQVSLVFLTLAILAILRHLGQSALWLARTAVLVLIAGTASLWAVERIIALTA